MKRLVWLVVIGVFASLHAAGKNASYLVADFNTSDAFTLRIDSDTSVPAPSLTSETNLLDQTPAVALAARLKGQNAGWSGFTLPVNPALIPDGTDTIEFDMHGMELTRDCYLTLEEADGARWNVNVPVTREWTHKQIRVAQFEWFMGPEGRKAGRPQLSKLKGITVWVGGVFQGPNGFALDNVRLVDDVPPVVLRLVSETTVPLQTATTVTLEASETTGGPRSEFTGQLWLDLPDRSRANVPQTVEMHDGTVSFELFARESGPLDLYAYEPVSRYEYAVPICGSEQGLHVTFGFEGFDGQQSVFAYEPLAPVLKIQGGNAIPLSGYVKMSDHRGRTILSQFFNVAEMQSGRGKLMVPAPGLINAEVKLLAEPISSFAHVKDNLPINMPDTTETITANGLTTISVLNWRVTLEELPSTATVLGEDRFPIFSMMISPRENVLYKSPFGISSGSLFHMQEQDIVSTGGRRLQWHRRVGSFWGRNDLWWHETETEPGNYLWAKANQIVSAYRSRYITLLAVLCYNSAWSRSTSPADEKERNEWRNWVTQIYRTFTSQIKAYEVWNEPNGEFWKPKPDAKAYRELVKVTYEALRKLDELPRVVAGAMANFDPVFLDTLLQDGYDRYLDVLSFHPYPKRPDLSPDDNSLAELCEGMRDIMRQHGAIKKELWITEIGWPTTPFGVTDLYQANYLVRAYTLALSHRVTKVFWFNLIDWESLAWGGTPNGHLGLMNADYRPKPAYAAYSVMQFMLGGNNVAQGEIQSQGKARIHQFDVEMQSYKWPGKMYTAWCPKPGDTQDIELPMTSNGATYVIDYLGAELQPELLRVETSQKANVTSHTAEDHHDHETSGTVNDHKTSGTESDHDHGEETPKLSLNDTLTTRTYRIHVTDEPLYIWDSGKVIFDPTKKRHVH